MRRSIEEAYERIERFLKSEAATGLDGSPGSTEASYCLDALREIERDRTELHHAAIDARWPTA